MVLYFLERITLDTELLQGAPHLIVYQGSKIRMNLYSCIENKVWLDILLNKKNKGSEIDGGNCINVRWYV